MTPEWHDNDKHFYLHITKICSDVLDFHALEGMFGVVQFLYSIFCNVLMGFLAEVPSRPWKDRMEWPVFHINLCACRNFGLCHAT